MKPGDKISWNGVNRVISGIIVREFSPGQWLVRLDNEKHVIVNEKSIIKDV